MDNLEFEKWRITYIEQQKKDRMLLRFDHEKAMQKARLDHESEIYKYKLEIEKLKASQVPVRSSGGSRSSSADSAPRKVFSDEDIEFSNKTLYDEGKDCHLGKLAKTPAFHASKIKADELEKKFFNDKTFEKYKIQLDKEDFKKHRIKSLIHFLLWAHSISARAAKWPDAPDMDLITKIQEEIITKLDKYSAKPIQIILDFLQEIWKEEISETIDLDTTLVGDYIDRVCEDYRKKTAYLDEVRMENSPFVKIMVEKLKELDSEFDPQPLINHLKAVKLRDYISRKKSDKVTFYVAHHYYRYKVHPLLKDKYDEVTWCKEGNFLVHELRDMLSKILDPLEDEVQDEYVLFERKRRERGVLDSVW